MAFITLLTVFALASSASVTAQSYIAPRPSSGSSSAVSGGNTPRSGLVPDFGSSDNSAAQFVSGSGGASPGSLLRQQQPGLSFLQTLSGRDNVQASTSGRPDGQRIFDQFSGASNVQPGFAPKYEEHNAPRAGEVPVTITITNRVTQTHTLRVPSTSDVWVTSVTMMLMPVTQLSTQRSYAPEAANTVTSVIRITKTPIEVVTRTAEIYPTKTLVSVFTRFVTETETVELWQNIVHRATNYEVLTVPVLETQTLLQRLFTTTTVTRTVDVTSVQTTFVPRSGSIPTFYNFN